MRILAFDQAVTITGYAVFEDDTMVEYGRVKKKTTEFVDLEIRGRSMALDIISLIKKWSPDLVAIEDVYGNSANPKVTIQLSRLQGEIIGYNDVNGIPTAILASTTWRTMIGIESNQHKLRTKLKREAKDFVLDRFGLKVRVDEADAICIGCAVLFDIQKHKEEDIDGNEDSDVRES